MTEPRARPAAATKARKWPESVTRELIVELARGIMICETCEWAVRPGDECAEPQFVRGCIHWSRRRSANTNPSQ